MRRFWSLGSLAAVLLLGALALAGLRPAVAQDATPPAEEDVFGLEGVAFEPLGFVTAEELPAAPADLALIRFTIDPGAGFPVEASDPSAALVLVESGTLTVQVEVPITVTRAATIAAFSTPGADERTIPAPEEMAAGTAFTMGAGDSAYFPPSIAGQVTNAGQEPAVLLAATIEPQSGDGAAASPAAGTPAP